MKGTDLGPVAEEGQREELEKAPFPLVLFLPQPDAEGEGEPVPGALWLSTKDAMVEAMLCSHTACAWSSGKLQWAVQSPAGADSATMEQCPVMAQETLHLWGTEGLLIDMLLLLPGCKGLEDNEVTQPLSMSVVFSILGVGGSAKTGTSE